MKEENDRKIAEESSWNPDAMLTSELNSIEVFPYYGIFSNMNLELLLLKRTWLENESIQ